MGASLSVPDFYIFWQVWGEISLDHKVTTINIISWWFNDTLSSFFLEALIFGRNVSCIKYNICAMTKVTVSRHQRPETAWFYNVKIEMCPQDMDALLFQLYPKIKHVRMNWDGLTVSTRGHLLSISFVIYPTIQTEWIEYCYLLFSVPNKWPSSPRQMNRQTRVNLKPPPLLLQLGHKNGNNFYWFIQNSF